MLYIYKTKSKLFLFFLIYLIYYYFFVNFVNADGRGSIGGAVTLDNPLGPGSTDPNLLIGQVINAVLGIVGSLALVMFIYGGLTWMLAAGNQEKVRKGKDILVWAAVGLVVIFSSYALVRFVFSGLGIQ